MNKKTLIIYVLLSVFFAILTACVQTEPIPPTLMPYPSTQTPLPTETPIPTKTPLPTETPLPTLTPEGDIGSTWTRQKDGMVMVYVPKGIFAMGSDTGDPDEQPVRDVYLDAFWIDQTEVTNTMFARFAPRREGKSPVQRVSWEEATAYCEWVGSRLPTEAEWEKAARGTEGFSHPWGNQLPTGDLVNFADVNSRLSWEDTSVDDGYEKVAPVGSFPEGSSLYGALDMAGNLSEWVNDWYGETYYSDSPLTNPQGPDDGFFRVLRGGSYSSTAASIRSADRAWFIPEGSADYMGFRCAQSTVVP